MRALRIGTLAALVSVSASGPTATVPPFPSPPETKLAALDSRTTHLSRATVVAYEQALNDLASKCHESRDDIGDIAMRGAQAFSAIRVPITNLEFLRAMDRSSPKRAASLDLSCAELGDLLVTAVKASPSRKH
jgi:hypothetical protein